MSTEASSPDEQAILLIEQAETAKADTLSLAGLGLTDLPDQILQLPRLRNLDLSRNDFAEVPKIISKLPLLDTLSLSNNHLSRLPPWLLRLRKIQTLRLDENSLSEVPPEIGNLTNLKELTLAFNPLSALPPDIQKLKNLTHLDLERTGISLPEEILTRRNEPQVILQAYFEGVDSVKEKPLDRTGERLVRTGKTTQEALETETSMADDADPVAESAAPQKETPTPPPQAVLAELLKDPSALNDRPVGPDRLDFSRYIHAFARILTNPETATPLTIGLYGAWGMGKSFMMGKIRQTMQEALAEERKQLDEMRRQQPWTTRLGDWISSLRPLATPDPEPEPGQKYTLPQRIRRWVKTTFTRPPAREPEFHFIEFNAWVYSGSDSLWAGLITHLYDQVEKFLGWRAARFRLGQSFFRSVRRTLGLLAIYGLLALAISLVLDSEAIQDSWNRLREEAQLAINVFAGGAIGAAALANLRALIFALRDLVNNLALSRARNLRELSSRRDFRDQIGFMADIKDELRVISNMLQRGKRGRPTRVVVFIDDLDRCEHSKAVEVLQAIMLLLADEDGAPFIIFLGLDARVIVKAIEEEYGDVLVKAGITGYEYLDKIVQIPFVIPAATEKALQEYIDSLLWSSDEKEAYENLLKELTAEEVEEPVQDKSSVPEDGRPPGTSPRDERRRSSLAHRLDRLEESIHQDEIGKAMADELTQVIEQVRRRLDGEGPDLDEAEKLISDLQKRLEKAQRESRQVAVTLTKEEREAFAEFTLDLLPNPRRIKRLVNIYRYARQLAPDFDARQHRKLIRWLILTEQWPFRTAWILEQIENDFQKQTGLANKPGTHLSTVYRSIKKHVYRKGFEHLQAIDGDPDLFLRFIKNGPLLTVGDIQLGVSGDTIALRTLTHNLNPAIQSEVAQAAAGQP